MEQGCSLLCHRERPTTAGQKNGLCWRCLESPAGWISSRAGTPEHSAPWQREIPEHHPALLEYNSPFPSSHAKDNPSKHCVAQQVLPIPLPASEAA